MASKARLHWFWRGTIAGTVGAFGFYGVFVVASFILSFVPGSDTMVLPTSEMDLTRPLSS